jgi:ABC-2 type transport system permease protein
MLTWNIFSAELLKTRKMPINIILLFILSILGILLLGGFAVLGLVYGNSYIGDPRTIYSYPNSLNIATFAITAFSTLICIIYSANSMGLEYSRDTWKMILPRYGSRTTFLIAKLTVAFLAMVLFMFLTLAIWLSFSFLCTKILGVTATSDYVGVGTFDIRNTIKLIIMIMARMAFYGLITMLVTLAFRSLIGGIVSGIGLSITLGNINEIPLKTLVRAMPTIHISNIEAHWIKDNTALERLQASFGYAISLNTSLIVLFIWFVIIIGLMFYLFDKRDIAGLG